MIGLYVVLVVFGFLFLFVYFPYFKKRREKLYIMDMSNEPILLKRLGYIMNELKPSTRVLKVKKSALSREEKYRIANSTWELKTDFKTAVDSKNAFIIIGKLGKKSRNETEIDCTLTRDQIRMIIEAEDILSTLNGMVDLTANSKIQEFKNTAQASILTMDKMEQVKTEIINAMKHYGQGNVDAMSIFAKVYGLERNEINWNEAQRILDDKLVKDLQLKMLKAEKNNGNKEKRKKKVSLKKIKVAGE